MDDLISRQAALQAMDTWDKFGCGPDGKLVRCNGDNHYVPYVHYDDMVHAIKHLPSAQPEQRWILCSERLPEVSGRYLVTRGINACGAMWNRVYIINYSDLMGLKPERIWWDGNVGKSDFERIDDVIAWMPLPEPYREEER